MRNPFYIGKKFSEEAYVEREETPRVLELIRSGANVVLYAPRRCGKTWFGIALKEKLGKTGVTCIWLDLFSIATVREFVESLNEEIIKSFKLGIKGYFARFLDKYVGSFSVGVGSVSLNFSPRNEDEVYQVLKKSLESIEELSEGNAVVFIDEIQEVARFDDKFLNVFRSVIQAQNVTYVFLGSRRSVISRLFFETQNPMFKMARKFELSTGLPARQTREFIREKFMKTGKKITDEGLSEILKRSALHPYYVQLISSEVWLRTKKVADISTVEEAVESLKQENSFLFQSMIENVRSKYTLTVLRMLMSDELSYNARNLAKWEIKSPASLAKTLKKLEEEEIIVRSGKSYRILDPLFEEYLMRLFR